MPPGHCVCATAFYTFGVIWYYRRGTDTCATPFCSIDCAGAHLMPLQSIRDVPSFAWIVAPCKWGNYLQVCHITDASTKVERQSVGTLLVHYIEVAQSQWTEPGHPLRVWSQGWPRHPPGARCSHSLHPPVGEYLPSFKCEIASAVSVKTDLWLQIIGMSFTNDLFPVQAWFCICTGTGALTVIGRTIPICVHCTQIKACPIL